MTEKIHRSSQWPRRARTGHQNIPPMIEQHDPNARPIFGIVSTRWHLFSSRPIDMFVEVMDRFRVALASRYDLKRVSHWGLERVLIVATAILHHALHDLTGEVRVFGETFLDLLAQEEICSWQHPYEATGRFTRVAATKPEPDLAGQRRNSGVAAPHQPPYL